MPKGRGRGRNLSLTHNTSRRENRSSARLAASSSGTRGSLRRSARIAEQSTIATGPPAANASVADVARRTQTAERIRSRAVETDFVREGSRHLSRRNRTNENVEQDPAGGRRNFTTQRPRELANRHSSSVIDDQTTYGMDMIVQPPSTARLGAALRPPVTVRLRTANGETAGEADNAETANLLAVATLTADSFNDSANPIDPNSLLEGRRFDSIHPFIGDDDLHGHETAETRSVGYVSFPDLVIRQEGTYRIRVTLIKVQSATNETPLASPGGSSVQVIDSNPITVERNATIDLDFAEDGGELL